jgi:hypothetical protein
MHQQPEPNNEESNQALTHPPKDIASSTAADAHQSRNVSRSELRVKTGSKQGSPAVARRATGQRTAAGKQRSKYNALKQGLFSQVVVLEGELRPQYESLLATLLEHFQPVGSLEQVLMEKLAMLLWRHRRLVVAEGAEIRQATVITTG